MSAAQDLRARFVRIGGQFCTPVERLEETLSHVRVFLFDWDGVFNDGMKYGDQGSPFGEVDSMGVNLLRLSYWLKYGHMPLTGIITGATNEAAEYFARREGLEFCVRGFTDKGTAFRRLCEMMEIQGQDVAFIFDDVLDLPVAKSAAVRYCVRRDTNVLFTNYVLSHRLCDYLTAARAGHGAVRECCELMIGLCYDFQAAIDVRIEYGQRYQEFLALRKATKTIVIAP